MAFLDAVKKQARYGECVYQIKALKSVVTEVNSGRKGKKQSTNDVFRG